MSVQSQQPRTATICIYPVPAGQSAEDTVRKHIEDAVQALCHNFLLSEEDAVGLVGRGFIDWLGPQIASDANPIRSANEFCREVLDAVGDARREANAARRASGIGGVA